ncbi:MAG: GatB/YqeY domain-containing protein, partial [Anaerolineales bacterium]|nr:GatB/YqeY domain-containing protein [Anaerolineales bacterium]
LSEEDLLALIQKEAKSRRESILDAQKADRADLVVGYEAELAIIESYLPKGLTREELVEMAQAAIAEAGATDAKQQGVVMKILAPRTKGRADGKLVNEIVRELLG